MIILNAQVEAVASRKDMTMKLTFGTQEIKEGGKLFSLQNKMVSLGIAENDITPEEIELLQSAKLSIDDVPNGKSKSQQLRGVMYRYWEQHDTGHETFIGYYDHVMNTHINNIKSKLE